METWRKESLLAEYGENICTVLSRGANLKTSYRKRVTIPKEPIRIEDLYEEEYTRNWENGDD